MLFMGILLLKCVSVFVQILTILTLLTIFAMPARCNAHLAAILNFASLVWLIIIFTQVLAWKVVLLSQSSLTPTPTEFVVLLINAHKVTTL